LEKIYDYIKQYIPQEQDLFPILKPFLPDFIPCIGDIDAFVGIGRPDTNPDLIGLEILDEPNGVQSNPSSKYQLRSTRFAIKSLEQNRNKSSNSSKFVKS
jgi:intraflagellar transport protein 46